jgi:hypothetical protein
MCILEDGMLLMGLLRVLPLASLVWRRGWLG